MRVFDSMIGVVFASVSRDGGALIFRTEAGKEFKFHHHQDCCESVVIDDIVGDLSDLVGVPLTMAEEVDSDPDVDPLSDEYGSHTWTFYKFASAKGFVTVKFLGTSNGYYSERVNLCVDGDGWKCY